MAKGFKVTINTKALLAKQHKAFAHVNVELEQKFELELTTEKWAWPRSTQRKNGEVVSSPRDRVDTGELLRSYYRQARGPNAFVHSWSAPHALAIHSGAQLRSGGVILPTPWTESPVEELPKAFADAYRKV
jgi:hypothetical protein